MVSRVEVIEARVNLMGTHVNESELKGNRGSLHAELHALSNSVDSGLARLEATIAQLAGQQRSAL